MRSAAVTRLGCQEPGGNQLPGPPVSRVCLSSAQRRALSHGHTGCHGLVPRLCGRLRPCASRGPGAEGFTRSVTLEQLEQLSPRPAGDALARRVLVSARRCQGPVRELVSPPARRACLFEGDRPSERHVDGLVAEAEAAYLVPPFHGYSGGFPETKAPCASRPKSRWVPAGLCGRSCCVQSPRVAGAATAGVRAHGVSTQGCAHFGSKPARSAH